MIRRIPNFYNSDAAAEHYLGIRWPRAIWQAVLEQAIRDVVEGAGDWETVDPTFRAEIKLAAECWVSDTTNEPRRFEWVCEQLGLEPSAVRRSIAARMPQPDDGEIG